MDDCIIRINCNRNKCEYMVMLTSDSTEMIGGNCGDCNIHQQKPVGVHDANRRCTEMTGGNWDD